jgi:hypothetical protein
MMSGWLVFVALVVVVGKPGGPSIEVHPEPVAQRFEVRSQFLPGVTRETFELVADIRPAPPAGSSPMFRLLGATPLDPAITLSARLDPADGRFHVTVPVTAQTTTGRLQVQLGATKGAIDLHSASFAVRSQIAGSPATRPSAEGNFVLITTSADSQQAPPLLIGRLEQPLDDLPVGVNAGDLRDAYSLAVLGGAATTMSKWQAVFGVTPEMTKSPRVFFRAPDGTAWQALDARPIADHPLVQFAVQGPGVYLLVAGVAP